MQVCLVLSKEPIKSLTRAKSKFRSHRRKMSSLHSQLTILKFKLSTINQYTFNHLKSCLELFFFSYLSVPIPNHCRNSLVYQCNSALYTFDHAKMCSEGILLIQSKCIIQPLLTKLCSSLNYKIYYRLVKAQPLAPLKLLAQNVLFFC